MPFVELAIWHPTMQVLQIEDEVGVKARIARSAGDQRVLGSGVHFETYCRFDLGAITPTKAGADLRSFERFRPLLVSPEFRVRGANALAYFSMCESESEVFLGKGAVSYLTDLGLGIVLRQLKSETESPSPSLRVVRNGGN